MTIFQMEIIMYLSWSRRNWLCCHNVRCDWLSGL